MFETTNMQVIGALLDRKRSFVYAPVCSSSSNYKTLIESHRSRDRLGLLEWLRRPVLIITSDAIGVEDDQFVALIKHSKLPGLSSKPRIHETRSQPTFGKTQDCKISNPLSV